MPQTTNFSAMF